MKVLIVLQFLLILVSGQSSDYDYFDDCSANIACLTDFEPHEHCLPLDYLCDVYIDCLDGADESPPLNCKDVDLGLRSRHNLFTLLPEVSINFFIISEELVLVSFCLLPWTTCCVVAK